MGFLQIVCVCVRASPVFPCPRLLTQSRWVPLSLLLLFVLLIRLFGFRHSVVGKDPWLVYLSALPHFRISPSPISLSNPPPPLSLSTFSTLTHQCSLL